MDKEDVVHKYTGRLVSINRDDIKPVTAAWMDLEIIILSEATQKEKDKYHLTSLICEI